MKKAPPGILDLILWNPSPDDQDRFHAEAFDLQPRLWSQLPEHLLHSVLAWLPFQRILCFRSVCRGWKALFDSPSFHHFPSHAPHVPPWIFFLCASRYRCRQPGEESDPDIHYDDGRDDTGFVFEGSEQGSDDDSDSVCDDSGDAQEAMRLGEHGDIHGAMMSDDQESMHDVGICCDHVDRQGAVARDDTHINDSEPFEELLLIFDCASESWRPPLAMPTGFKCGANSLGAQNSFARFNVCSSQEHVLIPMGFDMSRFLLFNPGAPWCKELPPCIDSLVMAVGFSVEMATPLSSNIAGDLPSLSKRNVDQSVQEATTDKIMQVVVVGKIGMGMYVVKSFSSTTGSWNICGYFQHSGDLYFADKRMMFYKGSFYGLTAKGILKLDIVQGGQSMEYTFRETAVLPGDFDLLDVFLKEWRLLATKDSLYMVVVEDKYVPSPNNIEDILIREYLPHAADNACWKLHAYVPKPILENYFGEINPSTIVCLAHGDLIFFGLHNRRRFLIYELRTRVWRFSAKSKWFHGKMSFLWEPLLRN